MEHELKGVGAMNCPTLFALGVLSALPTLAAAPALETLWETEAVLKVPEGVALDAVRQVLYVSNIDGKEPWGRDGAGSIARVNLDGTVRDVEWITGFDAPKGLAVQGDELFIADLDHLIVVHVPSSRIHARLAVPEARRLNDVSIAADGAVYITDSATGVVHRYHNKQFTVVSRAFKGPNGILADGRDLYVLDQETLHRIVGDGVETVVTGIRGHVDGVVRDGDGFLLTCWEGMIYHGQPGGTATLLLDTRTTSGNAADPAFDAERRILYVPTFWKNTVVAYQVR